MAKKKYSRGRLEILADMVKLCTEEKIKTHIMFNANLSHMQVDQYLKDLQEKGLVEELTKNDNNYYRATAQGRRFLNVYEKMVQVFDVNKYKQV